MENKKACTFMDSAMYKNKKKHHILFTDFHQPLDMNMNPDNRWSRKAETITRGVIERKSETVFEQY